MTSAVRHVRRRTAVFGVLSLIVSIVAATRIAPAAPQTHPVGVKSNFFSPREIHISPGDTVTWTALGEGHTVEADDGRFNFFPQRFLNRNEQVSFVFVSDETVRYHCRVHGADGGGGMSGVIVVGAGSPDPTPDPTPAVVEHRRVPSEYATIAAALDGITPGGVVHLAFGVYSQSVSISTPGVSIVGDGTGPGDVVIDGGGVRRTGILLAARGTAARNLTVTRHTAEGLAVRGTRGARVTDVVVDGNGDYGILVADSSGVTVSDVVTRGHRVAGVSVKGCDECDTIVQRADSSANRYGILLDDVGSVVVRDSHVHGNATGIVARSLITGGEVVQRGAHIIGNLIEANTAAIAGADPLDIAVRSGVWLAGGWHDVVEGNRISGHDYGVLVTSLGIPALDGRIAGNVVDDSMKADIAWDGIGAGVCFQRNARPGGAEPSSRPPLAQTVYGCGGPVVAGIPEPTVIADLALYAAAA